MRMSRCHKFSIAVAYILGILGLYAVLIQLFYLFMQLFEFDETSSFIKIGHDVERKIVWPITDFFMALAILYMFYSFNH